MRILCIGNNSEHTDVLTKQLADSQNYLCHGLLSEIDCKEIMFEQPGFYHTTVLDLSYAKLFEIAKQFDKIIVLDQPRESYYHPDSFYRTIKIANDLSSVIEVVWQQPLMKQAIGFFDELVKENKSFCIFPFIELLTNNDHTTVCCRSTTPVTTIDRLQDYATDANYQIIRNNMLAGVKMSEHCQSCYNLEDLGMISPRQQETVEWANRLNLTSLDDLKKITKPAYYEIRPSNVCNLQCRTCNPMSSELINQEYARLKLIDKPLKFKYSGFDIVDLDNVKKLYVAGGEPTAMPEFYNFIDQVVENNQKFDFLINTNAVKFSDKFKAQLKKLPHLSFIVSVDGFGKLNHYIRWPSSWENVVENVRYLINNNHYVCFNVTVSMYNITELYTLLKFFDEEFPTAEVHSQVAVGVTSPMNFPDASLALEDLIKIKHLKCYHNNWLLSSFIDSMIKYFEQSHNVNVAALEEFVELNQTLDHSRNVKLKDYSPKLWQSLEGKQ